MMADSTSVVDRSGQSIISRLWERNYDPLTTRIIEDLSIESTARCLDLGAGAGSMAYWLAGHADRGSVLAVDIDTSDLDDTRASNLTVRRLDITRDDIRDEIEPASFDLVLARAVLSTLPHSDDLLERAAQWLAPGGWLVVEDFYLLPSQDSSTPSGRAVIDAYQKTFDAIGSDTRWARRMPAGLAKAGLTSLGLNVRPLGSGMAVSESELIRARMELQGQPLVDNGWVTAEALADFVGSLDNPESRDIATLQISAWGRRPAV